MEDHERLPDRRRIVVVPRDGQEVDPVELVRYCSERMAAFMVPRYVRLVPELPKTPTEKIQKFELRALGADGAWDSSAAA